jgi:cytochrome c-type biogenesis protein CcmH/NrfF
MACWLKKPFLRAILLLLTVGAVCGCERVDSDTMPTHAAARDLASRLMSPYCPGRTLADCSSSGAAELRGEIRARLEAGESTAQIKDALEQRFGSQISGEPGSSGVGLLAWTIPPVIAASTLLWVVVRLRQATRPQPAGKPETEEPTLNARLTEELERLD